MHIFNQYLRIAALTAAALLAAACILQFETPSPSPEDKPNNNEKEADTLEITASQTTFGAGGGTLTVDLKTNMDVTVLLDAYTAAWIEMVPAKSVSNLTAQFIIAPNPNYEGRTGTLVFSNPEKGISRALDITQLQKDALVVSDGKVNAPVDGGLFGITLGHNVAYACAIDVDWIRDVTAKAYTQDQFSFLVDGNPAPEVRTGHIRFSGKGADGTDLVQEVLVTQDGLVVYITLSPTAVKVYSEGGAFTVQVDSNVEPSVVCDDWIVRLDADPDNPSLYSFQVGENTDQDDRVGTISFEHAYYETPALVSVRQPGLSNKLGYDQTGIYGLAGERWLFTVGTDQLSLSGGDTRTFTLLNPADNRFFRVSGIPTHPEEGEVISARVVQNKWKTVEAAFNTQLSVESTDGPFAELLSDQGFSIVVKTR